MINRRVYIIGASGVGKTTLAKAVANFLNIPHFDSDDYFHYPTDPPFQKQRSPEERAKLLSNDLGMQDSWVLSGGAGTWQPPIEFNPTLVVFLYLPPEIRLERLRVRERDLYGSRILPGGDMHKDHEGFIKWTSGYDDGTAEGTNTLPIHKEYIAKVHSLLELVSPQKTDEQLKLILHAMSK